MNERAGFCLRSLQNKWPGTPVSYRPLILFHVYRAELVLKPWSLDRPGPAPFHL